MAQAVILLSASSNASDIEAASQYAHILNGGQNQVITVAYGGADGNLLGVVSRNSFSYERVYKS